MGMGMRMRMRKGIKMGMERKAFCRVQYNENMRMVGLQVSRWGDRKRS